MLHKGNRVLETCSIYVVANFIGILINPSSSSSSQRRLGDQQRRDEQGNGGGEGNCVDRFVTELQQNQARFHESLTDHYSSSVHAICRGNNMTGQHVVYAAV